MSLLSPTAQATGQATARLRNKKSNHPRQSSSCYSALTSKQITGLREAFTTIDSDGDGFITRNDVKTMLVNLGQNGDDAIVDKYMRSALKEGATGNERVNFTQFLTMFGEHLSELDEGPDLVAAFECFDEHDEGKIDAGELRYWLSEVGDRMQDEEIDRLLSGPFMDRGGRNFDYKACECERNFFRYVLLSHNRKHPTIPVVEAVKMSEPAELD